MKYIYDAKCECGGSLKISNIKGQDFDWEGRPSVKLLIDFYALTCSQCGEIFLRGSDAEKLDELL